MYLRGRPKICLFIFGGASSGAFLTVASCTPAEQVCASGMKAVMLAAQSISLGDRKTIVAGGFESMSNVPFMSLQARSGLRLGHSTLVDGKPSACGAGQGKHNVCVKRFCVCPCILSDQQVMRYTGANATTS